jgi:hypothetical protein
MKQQYTIKEITVCPSYLPLKIAAVTNNRNFFNCILLLHYVKMNFSLSRFIPILQMTPYASGTPEVQPSQIWFNFGSEEKI